MAHPGGRSLLLLILAIGIRSESAPAQADSARYARDRGTGVPASLFATYIRKGELLVYPFFEYVRDKDHEYQPEEFGVGPDVDFRGRLRSYAGQIWIGYGVTDWLALEFEAAYVHARLERSPADTFPTQLPREESGLTDIETHVRTRFLSETRKRPELFAYAEITFPTQTGSFLIGEPDLDLKPGIGFAKGLSWGTIQGRFGVEYNREESKLDISEVSLEWIRRFSPGVRIHVIFEGGETGALDEWELIPGILLRLSDRLSIKFDSQLALSSKSADWAPQAGLMFSFP